MNKTYLIVGGASVVSLVAGAGGGYLIAKKKFDAEIEHRIDEEVEKTKKHFSVLLMEARTEPESPADISAEDDEDEDDEIEPEELTEADEAVIKKGRESLASASAALVNYQGYAEKPKLEDLVTSNIFADAPTKRKKLPPRDPQGHFVKQHTDDEEKQVDDPYIIDHEAFLLNESEYEQENLKYFRQDKTLIQVFDNEPIDIGRVGEVNLTLFPDVPDGEPSIICVRNEGLEMDYEILLTDESLTVHMGMGEDDADLPDDEFPDDYPSDA